MQTNRAVGLVQQVFTLSTLAEYDGQRNGTILMSVRGFVYDVSSGAKFYGPGGMYGCVVVAMVMAAPPEPRVCADHRV